MMRDASLNTGPVMEAAFGWLAEVNSGAPLPHDRQAAFDAWLMTDPEHSAAYVEAGRLWSDLGWAEALNEPAFEAAAPALLPMVRRRVGLGAAPRNPGRRPLVAALSIAAALVAAVAIAPAAYRLALTQLDVQTLETVTAAGEIRRLDLPDGSHVVIGGRSTLHVRLSRGRRDIDLRGGEAYFEVASDADRPFVVHAGDFSATAVGTAFEVRRGGVSEVAVTEGRVRVAAKRGGEAHLLAGQAGRMNPDGSLQVMSYDPGTIGRWREQRASFHDTPLAQVVETLNRYHPAGVELADADLAAMPITAAFRFDQMETALNALAGGRDLAVRRDANGRLIVSRSRLGTR